MTSAGTTLLTTDRIELVPFVDAPDELRAELAAQLTGEHIARFLGMPPAESIAARVERDRSGESLHLVLIVDGAPAGWVGWLVYPPDRRCVETSTYLAPTWWRSGLNSCAKSLQWAAARVARLPLLASVNVENHRSIAAVERLWPFVEAQVVFEAHRPRTARLYRLEAPPATDLTWPDETVASVAALLAGLDVEA